MNKAMSGPIAGVFGADAWRTLECQAHYADQGWVLLKGFFDWERDIGPVHRYVNHLIDLKLAEHGLHATPTGTDRIRNQDFIRLCAKDRTIGGEIYRACRHLCALHQLAAKPEMLELVRRLMQTEFVNFIPYTAMRIDIRGEEKYLFPWHQDYPYIQGSMDGVVIWIPLFDVREGHGGVELLSGSHRLGLQRVVLVDPANLARNGAHSIRMADTERFDAMPSVTMDFDAGDALVFHTLLVHRSRPMTAGDVRWTTQIRYANLSNADAVRRGWPGGMIEGAGFEQHHPEYVVS